MHFLRRGHFLRFISMKSCLTKNLSKFKKES